MVQRWPKHQTKAIGFSAGALGQVGLRKPLGPQGHKPPDSSYDTERVVGIEPTTTWMGTKNSTTELHPQFVAT